MKFEKRFFISKKSVFMLLAVMTFIAAVAAAETGGVDTGEVYQELEGFGASHVWSGGTLVSLGDNNPEICDVLFADLGLDIIRLRNNYADGDEFDYDYIANCEHAITNGRDRTGRPLKIMISSWSPPASLRSNNDIFGGGEATLAKSGGGYVYSDFGVWWADSVEQYAAQGMMADYISIQNEPDWDPSDYESCRFEPSETSNIAGYDPEVADTNCDGSINIVDALLAAKYYVGLIEAFC
ncbi:MAG: hypothetical protein JW881_06955 [Spirochaetales bacterium]|nr:hypothetical protein [Spirochaetales bacterium]